MQNNVGVQELPKVGSLPVLRACVRRMRVVVLRFFVEEDYLTQAVCYLFSYLQIQSKAAFRSHFSVGAWFWALAFLRFIAPFTITQRLEPSTIQHTT